MGDSLIENISNSYYRNAARLTNHPNSVKVIVEDEYDIPFWFDLLSKYAPDYDFKFSPYSFSESRSLVKGKSKILAMADQFGKYLIGCIDSDCDFLLKDFDEKMGRFHSHDYIIPTFSYSVENLVCEPHTLKKVCISAASNNVDFNFVDFIRDLSVKLYPLVIWSSFLIKLGKDELFSQSDWSSVFDIANTNLYLMSDCEIIERIGERVDNHIERITNECKEHLEEKQAFEKHLIDNGYVRPELAWTFVRGHDLFDFISESLVKHIVSMSCKEHVKLIESSGSSDKDKKDMKSHYHRVQHSHRDLLHTNFAWHDYHLHSLLISNKIKNIFIR